MLQKFFLSSTGIKKSFSPRILDKVIIIILIHVFTSNASGQIIVDGDSILSNVAQHPIGINVNYLMDGTYLSPSTSTEAALRELGVKFLRYPGGEKSDNYYWSLAPWKKSNPHFIRKGNCEFPSSDKRFAEEDLYTAKKEVLDFDEFVVLAKSIHADPLIVVPYDAVYKNNMPVKGCDYSPAPTLNDVIKNAKEWVRYANVKKKYKIKYWMIGNESWNTDSYNGYATAKEYATDIVEFSKAMKSVDPSIKIIVNGNNASWWSQVLSNASAYIDFLGVSNYPVDHYYKGYSFYLNKPINLTNEIDIAVNAIQSFAKEKDKKRLKVIVTEFNSIDYSNEWKNRNDMGHGLMTFEILGEQLKNPKVEGNYFWNTRWIANETDSYSLDDAITKDGKLTASGKALSIWGNNILDSMIYTTSTSLLRTFASIDKDGKTLSLFIINKDQKKQNTKIHFKHLTLNAILKYQALIGKNSDDTDPTFNYLTDIKLVSDAVEVDLQPFSISVIHLQLK